MELEQIRKEFRKGIEDELIGRKISSTNPFGVIRQSFCESPETKEILDKWGNEQISDEIMLKIEPTCCENFKNRYLLGFELKLVDKKGYVLYDINRKNIKREIYQCVVSLNKKKDMCHFVWEYVHIDYGLSLCSIDEKIKMAIDDIIEKAEKNDKRFKELSDNIKKISENLGMTTMDVIRMCCEISENKYKFEKLLD